MSKTVNKTSLLFSFLEKPLDEMLPLMQSMGWEWLPTGRHYDWSLKEPTSSRCIFQYTVSGEGEIEIGGKWHSLTHGQAFLVEIPGPYHYRLPTNSSHWEQKHLCLSVEALPLWRKITEQCGHIIQLGDKTELMECWETIYRLALNHEIEDIFTNSAYAYQFLMLLRKHANRRQLFNEYPASIQRCVQLLNSQSYRPISLEEMSEVSGISRFHLSRLFQQTVGEPPVQYLIKVRIKKSAQLLVQSDLSIEDIALRCGFSNGNYMAKVFKRWMSVSPKHFRQQALSQSIDKVTFTSF